MQRQKRSQKSKSGLTKENVDCKSPTKFGYFFENKARFLGTKFKQVLFGLIISGIFFACMEFIFALSGVMPLSFIEDPLISFTSSSSLFVEQNNNAGATILRTADNKLGYFNYQEFPKLKGENTYRVFSLGGSTTFGRPFTDKGSFSHWLHDFLDAADPSRNWEVINAGGISYASYRVANLMLELVQYQPDLFIVYTGQNEFLERRSYKSISKIPTWLINTNSVLSNSRIYSAMKRVLGSIRSASENQGKEDLSLSGEVDDVLAHSIGPVNYKRNDVLRGEVLKHYQLNLDRMVKLARNVGAKVIFVKPAVNLKDMSPFKSEHKAGLTDEELDNWNNYYYKARDLHEAVKYSEALDFYHKALRIDGRYAELYFQIGRALFALKRFDESEKFFWRAVDEDVAPLRMLSAMPGIISQVAGKYHVPLVDFQSILRDKYLQTYGHAVLGNELFLDHVHTNEYGYRLLGRALFNQLVKLEVLSPDTELTPEQISTVVEQVSSSLNEEDYRISMIHLGMVLDWAGKFEEAQNILFKSLDRFGPQPEVFELLGRIFSREGDAVEAMEYFHQALNAGYETAELYASLGNIYLEVNGDYPASIDAYRNSLRIDNNAPSVHVRLGYVYVLQGKLEYALFHYNEALRIQPDFLPAHVNLMALLFVEERYAEALGKGYKILQEHPDDYRTQYMLGKILLRQGKNEQAIQYFEEVLRINPEFNEAENSLRKAQLKDLFEPSSRSKASY